MVLQDTGGNPTASDGFDDNPYPSDSDPYSSPSSSSFSSSTRRFDPSLCPQPIPVLGPLLGFPESLMISRTEETIKFAEQKIGRVVTYDEAQALAGHLYKMEQTSSYFTAIGVGLGGLRCYQTAAVNRYPFYLPKAEKINPNKFMFIKGPLAHYLRHSWRAVLYMFVAGEFGKLNGQVVARPTAAQATANDPRMAKFTEELRVAATRTNASQARQVAEAREGGHSQKSAAGPSGQPEPSASRYRTVVPREAANPSQDASPTTGNDSWSSASDGDFVSSSDAALYNPSKPESTQRTQSASSWGRQPRPTEDDDASPTGGLFQDEVQSQSRPGESSWDRLRRGGAPAASPLSQRPPPRRSDPPRREQPGDSTRGSSSDSFPFVGSGEDRNEAQAQAQQEFDARMQREREGKDFNDEKRW